MVPTQISYTFFLQRGFILASVLTAFVLLNSGCSALLFSGGPDPFLSHCIFVYTGLYRIV